MFHRHGGKSFRSDDPGRARCRRRTWAGAVWSGSVRSGAVGQALSVRLSGAAGQGCADLGDHPVRPFMQVVPGEAEHQPAGQQEPVLSDPVAPEAIRLVVPRPSVDLDRRSARAGSPGPAGRRSPPIVTSAFIRQPSDPAFLSSPMHNRSDRLASASEASAISSWARGGTRASRAAGNTPRATGRTATRSATADPEMPHRQPPSPPPLAAPPVAAPSVGRPSRDATSTWLDQPAQDHRSRRSLANRCLVARRSRSSAGLASVRPHHQAAAQPPSTADRPIADIATRILERVVSCRSAVRIHPGRPRRSNRRGSAFLRSPELLRPAANACRG